MKQTTRLATLAACAALGSPVHAWNVDATEAEKLAPLIL